MQVLCAASEDSPDIKCPVCQKGFRLYWERPHTCEQRAQLPDIFRALREHHLRSNDHPSASFNIPNWAGLPQFSGAALLGGAW